MITIITFLHHYYFLEVHDALVLFVRVKYISEYYINIEILTCFIRMPLLLFIVAVNNILNYVKNTAKCKNCEMHKTTFTSNAMTKNTPKVFSSITRKVAKN